MENENYNGNDDEIEDGKITGEENQTQNEEKQELGR